MEELVLGVVGSILSIIIVFHLKGRFDLLHKKINEISSKIERLQIDYEEYKVSAVKGFVAKGDFKEGMDKLEKVIEKWNEPLKEEIKELKEEIKELKKEIKGITR